MSDDDDDVVVFIFPPVLQCGPAPVTLIVSGLSPPVWQLIGPAGCRSGRDWSVCSLISCNPLVIPLGSNISISPAITASYLSPRKQPQLSILVLSEQKIRWFSPQRMPANTIAVKVMQPSYWFWQTGEEEKRLLVTRRATIRVSGTTLTMTDKFGAKNQTFLKKFDAETRSLFILLVTDLLTSFSICKYQSFLSEN